MRKGLVRELVDLFLEFLVKQTDVLSLEDLIGGISVKYWVLV
ncbi:MAG: hypothetical protein ACOC3Z_00125 [Nanoarchaeota archaeon]